MAVQITPMAIQHTGMTASPAGSVAAWQVTFQLDAEKLLRVAISIPVAGPTTHHEAQLEALKILQVFLGDACDAAKKISIFKLDIIRAPVSPALVRPRTRVKVRIGQGQKGPE